MKEAKFIKKEDDLAEYEIDETNKDAKVDGKEYKAEKIDRRQTNEKKTR